MIILLDLNYTLVENSEEKLTPFTKQIALERYRKWLVELIKPHHVIMLTARPAIHEAATLESIKRKTGWLPSEAFFNVHRLMPPIAKEVMLKKYVLPKHGKTDYLAIESNPRTRAMYARYEIPSIFIEDGIEWEKLPL
jgi:hypothetical protein